MKRLKRKAKQRQVPNRPHKLNYERSCGKYEYGYDGWCDNCISIPNHKDLFKVSHAYNHRHKLRKNKWMK